MIFKTAEMVDADGNISTVVKTSKEAKKIQAKTNAYYDRQGLVQQAAGLREIANANREYNAVLDQYNQKLVTAEQLATAKAARDERAATAAAKYGDEVAKQKDNYDLTSKEAKKSIDVQREQIAINQKAATSFKGISAGMKAMALNIGAELAIVLAFQLAMKGFQKLDEKLHITKDSKLEAMESSIDKYNSALEETGNNIDTIKSLESEFKQLSQGVDDAGKNISLSADEYARYNEIANELASITPSLVQGYTDEGNAILNRNSAIQDGIDKQNEYLEAATKSYLSNSSGQNIIDGVLVNLNESFKEMNSFADNLRKTLQDIDGDIDIRMGSSRSGSNKKYFSDIVKEVTGAEINLSNPTMNDYRLLSQWNDQIVDKIREVDGADSKLAESASSYLDEMSSLYSALETEYQPIINYLNTYLSSIGAIEEVPEEMRDSFNEGLTALALSGETDVLKLKSSAKSLADEVSDNYVENIDGIRDLYEEAEDAQEKFLDGELSAEDTNKILTEKADALDSLADKYAETDEAMSAYYRNEANNMRNFVSENETTISNAIGKFDDLIEAARGAKERYDASIENGDYYTGVDNYKEIYDDIFDGKNNLGDGSLSFWSGAEQMLNTSFLKEASYDIDIVKKKLAEYAPLLEGGAESAALLGEKLLSIGDGNGKILNEYGEVIGEVAQTAEGIDFEIPRENIDQVAKKLGISTELLTALIDSSRQFANVDFYNPDEVVEAIKKTVEDEGAALKSASGDLYMGLSELQSQSGLQGVELDNLVEDIEALGVKIIDANANVQTLKTTLSDLGYIENGVFDFETAVEDFHRLNISAEDFAEILRKMEHDGIDTGINLEEGESYYDRIIDEYSELSELETVDPVADNTDSIDALTESINVLIETLGGIPPLNIKVNDEQLQTELNEINNLTDKKKEIIIEAVTNYEETGNLGDLAATINSLPKDVRVEVATAVADSVDSIEFIDGKLQTLDGKVSYPIIEILDNASPQMRIIDQGMNGLDSSFASPTIGVTDYATGTLTRINQLVNSLKTAGNIVINAALSIPGQAKGTPSSPLYRSHSSFPSMAKGGRGGRLGPRGNGGLTLTGELGTELIWLPSESRSFLVGQYGPEMVNLPGDAVVYPADETRKILGDTISPGRLRFGTGSMARGNMQFGSHAAKGTLPYPSHGSGGGSGSGKRNSGSGKSKSGSSSSKSEEFKEVFDWIEIAIDRIERAIDRLDLKARSVFKSWTVRNKALKDQISEVRKEIDLQQAGYNRYIKQANSVGLSSSWAKLVREGKVDISTIKDEDLAEKIKEYQEW